MAFADAYDEGHMDDYPTTLGMMQNMANRQDRQNDVIQKYFPSIYNATNRKTNLTLPNLT